MRGLIFLLLLACSMCALADGIENVRLRTEQDRARVVFDLEDAISYRAFTMSNPNRVVIDIDQINYPKALSLPVGVAAGENSFEVLERLRYAVRNDSGLRIVLDLNEYVALKHTALPPRQDYGHRLVLDLYRSEKAKKSAPAKTATGKPDDRVPATNQSTPEQRPSAQSEQRIATSDAPEPTPDDGQKALAILNGDTVSSGVKAAQNSGSKDVPEKTLIAAKPVTEQGVTVTREQRRASQTSIDQVAYRPPRDVVIAIDAGHGGHDVGAIGPKGTYEKDIVLRISRELAAAINREYGMRAILTREKDEYIGLRDRMQRARRRSADLFVSIHADAFRDRRVRGSSVYVLSQNGASSEAARWLAENENAADLVGGVRLGDKDDVVKSVLLDLSQSASIDASIDAADSVLAALKKIGKVHKPAVQKAGFMVLKSPDIPSLLVETAFISNPTEEKRLRSRSYQRKLARALTRGIVEYFSDNPIPETRFAENYQREHKVSRGDTLSEIAERYAVSMESIKLANEMSRDRVRTGEILTIP